MRTMQSNQSNQGISPTHMELGLLLSTILMLRYNKDNMPSAFRLLADFIPDIEDLSKKIAVFAATIQKKVNGSLLLCSGFEAILVDQMAATFKSVLVVPNSSTIDAERLALNYSVFHGLRVVSPFEAADMICPDTSILVPVYPLQDGSILSYNYSSKLLTVDARRSSYQIIGLEICDPLPIQYGYDPSGLIKVLAPVDHTYFTEFITLKA
ncbi:MAG: hypothetical protein JXB49_22855 [Bacteroidales bacterium]|nr:hypothetical protein [Bacteroidales bacterium]